MQVTYFPYLPLRENEFINLGNGVVIWHFYSLAEKYIPDKELREFVTTLLRANVQGSQQAEISGIAVVSIGNTDFRHFSELEEAQVQNAKLLLFLAKIAKNNASILGSGGDAWALSTSENFEPVYQNFELGNDHIAERGGYIINVNIGGYSMKEKKFFMPSHVVISPYGLSVDKELLTQLLRLQRRNGKRLINRILRATDLVFQAYYNNAAVSKNARILLVAAAFETLLDLKEPARRYFKDNVERYCDISGEIKYRHYYRNRQQRKIRDKNRSIKVLWADSFFELRNQIIHGDTVPEKQYQFIEGDRHLDISILFFILLIKSLINDKLPLPAFADTIKWMQRRDGTTGFCYEDGILEIIIARAFRRQQGVGNQP